MPNILTDTAAADACGELAASHTLGGADHAKFIRGRAAAMIAGEKPGDVLWAFRQAATIPGMRPHQWEKWVATRLAHERRRASYAAKTKGEDE